MCNLSWDTTSLFMGSNKLDRAASTFIYSRVIWGMIMDIKDAALAVWFAAFVTIVTLCFIIFLSLVEAATLTISGSMMGQGIGNITADADLLVVAINQTANGTTWQIWGSSV